MRRGRRAAAKTVLITGATGFIGRALTRALVERGDHVVALTRDAAKARDLFGPLVEIVEGLDTVGADRRIDAIVNLAGEPLAGGLWTASRKRRFGDSRIAVTSAVLGLIGRLDSKPEALITASAIGYYGDRGDEALTEASGPQPVFLSALCRHWEERAKLAARWGVRVCCLRIGLVLGAEGGAARPLALATRLGLGCVMGDGTQIMSWIHLDDLVRLTLFALDRPDLSNPVNAVAPVPVAHGDFMRLLGRTLRRRIVLRMPAKLVRLGMGELSDLFLTGQRVLPAAAMAAGFEFRFAEPGPALADLFGTATAATAGRLSVYMNDACTICRTEMEHYERLSTAESCPIAFERLGPMSTGLADHGLSDADLRRRLYVRDRRGELRSGVDAFAALWGELPRYRRAALLVRLQIIHGLVDLLYEGLCVPILAWWNRRTAPSASRVRS